jgi:hypothetical protein
MSGAFAPLLDVRTVPVLRAGVPARDVCRRGGTGAVAAVFERSFYLRVGEDFLCIGEPAIADGPTTLMVAARVPELGVQNGEPAYVSNRAIAIGDLLLDLDDCETWRPPEWPRPCAPARLLATCAALARRMASESPPGSLARAMFADDDTVLARLARPRVAQFVGWAKRHRRVPTINDSGGHGAARLSPPYGLIGLGPGLTPSGDDFLIGALAALDALNQTNMHALLARAIVAALARTSPLSASFLRAAAAGHVGENLYAMVAALIGGDADAAIAAAKRIGHTSGWDTLAAAVVTMRNL